MLIHTIGGKFRILIKIMARRIFYFLLIIGVSVFLFRDTILKWVAKVPSVSEVNVEKIQEVAEDLAAQVQEVKKEVVAPPPLRVQTRNIPSSVLTRAGVISWTNTERTNAGLSALSENVELNSAASAKLQDMFAKQYFAHVSPSGEAADDFVQSAHYEFVVIGENLAQGNFENDRALVTAWMGSPGHRANILNSRYTEIGVAVGKGSFEGYTTWLAVQMFGLPRSACPSPDAALKTRIDASENELKTREQALNQKRAELEAMQPKRGAEYEQAVAEYNTMVEAYNNLLVQTKQMIDEYNRQVEATNECVKGV